MELDQEQQVETSTLQRILDVVAEYSLTNKREKKLLEQARPKIEKRLKSDPIARTRKVKTIEDFVKFVEDIPERTRNPQLLDKTYLRWITSRYAKGGIGSISDIDQAWEVIAIFHAGKSRLQPQQRDINRIKDLHDLTELAEQMQDSGRTKSKRQQKLDYRRDQLEALIKKRVIEHVYEDSKINIYVPKTYEASKLLAKGTRWCTGGSYGASKSYFNDYNKRGKLYIIFFKNQSEKLTFTKDGERIEGIFPKRFQLQFETMDYENAASNSVTPEEISKQAPGSFKKAFPNRAEFNPDLSESDALKDVSTRPTVIKYMAKPTDKVILRAIDKGGIQVLKDVDAKHISPQLQLDIVRKNAEHIQYLQNPTTEAAKTAIKANPEVALYVNPLTDELARYACSLDSTMFDYCNIFLEEEMKSR